MGRGQISIDFLFAVTLITMTVLNLVYIANSESTNAATFDAQTKLKVFSVNLRDSVVKAYSIGGGFKIKKEAPIKLKTGDSIQVVFNQTTNSIVVTALINGATYSVVQRSPVPIHKTSNITLTPTNTTFWIVSTYNQTEGTVYVTLSP